MFVPGHTISLNKKLPHSACEPYLEPVTPSVKNIVVSQHGVPQKGETFWGEDEVRSECVFAAGGNKRYEATEDEERFAILLVKFLFAKHRFTVQSYFLPEIPFTKFCSEERIMNSE